MMVALENALKKVYEEIANTGVITSNQIFFIAFAENKMKESGVGNFLKGTTKVINTVDKILSNTEILGFSLLLTPKLFLGNSKVELLLKLSNILFSIWEIVSLLISFKTDTGIKILSSKLILFLSNEKQVSTVLLTIEV